MRYAVQVFWVISAAAITGLLYVSLMMAGHPIEQLAVRFPVFAGAFALVGDGLVWVVGFFRERVIYAFHLHRENPFVPSIDAFILFDIAMIAWLIAPLIGSGVVDREY